MSVEVKKLQKITYQTKREPKPKHTVKPNNKPIENPKQPLNILCGKYKKFFIFTKNR